MKKSMFIAIALTASLAACAQRMKEAAVPAAVKDAFRNTYTNAREVKWEKEGDNFEAEFEIGETDQSAVYSVTGYLIETEIEIKTEELPAAAREYVGKNHKDVKIKEAARITNAEGNVSYEAEIKGRDLLFDHDGKFIKEEAVSNVDKD
jgi:hypothetical protein